MIQSEDRPWTILGTKDHKDKGCTGGQPPITKERKENREGDQRGSLKIWTPNCDTLTNDKLEELKCRISMEDEAPDVIALSEVRPKNAKFPRSLVEYQIAGYEMESRNIENTTGRGIIMYMNKNLKYRLKNLNTQFEEILAVHHHKRRPQQYLTTSNLPQP